MGFFENWSIVEKCKCNVIPFLKKGLKRDVNFYMSFPHLFVVAGWFYLQLKREYTGITFFCEKKFLFQNPLSAI